jgi:hypothetical protein
VTFTLFLKLLLLLGFDVGALKYANMFVNCLTNSKIFFCLTLNFKKDLEDGQDCFSWQCCPMVNCTRFFASMPIANSIKFCDCYHLEKKLCNNYRVCGNYYLLGGNVIKKESVNHTSS